MFYIRTNDVNKGLNKINSIFNDQIFQIGMRTDVKEDDKEYIVSTELPGVDKKSINITYEDSILRISVKQDSVSEDKNDNYIKKERQSFNASRDFYLENGDENQIKAKLDNGILTIKVQKLSEKALKRKCISVE